MIIYLALATFVVLWVIAEIRICRIKILNQEINTKFPAFKDLVHQTLNVLGINHFYDHDCRIKPRCEELVERFQQLKSLNKELKERNDESARLIRGMEQVHKETTEGNQKMLQHLRSQCQKRDSENKDAWRDANMWMRLYKEANTRIAHWQELFGSMTKQVNKKPNCYGLVPDDLEKIG